MSDDFAPYSQRFATRCPRCGDFESKFVHFTDYDSMGDDGIMICLTLQCENCASFYDMQVNSGNAGTYVAIRYLPDQMASERTR